VRPYIGRDNVNRAASIDHFETRWLAARDAAVLFEGAHVKNTRFIVETGFDSLRLGVAASSAFEAAVQLNCHAES